MPEKPKEGHYYPWGLLPALVWLGVGTVGVFTGWQNSIVALWWVSIIALAQPSISNEIQDWKKRKEKK